MNKKFLQRYFRHSLLCLLVVLAPQRAHSTSDTLSDKELISLFTYMHKEDVSNVRHPEIRKHVFLFNFSVFIRIIENQGFPQFKEIPKRRKNKAIIIRTSALILIHILQYKPQQMLTDEIIHLLDRELKSQRMPPIVLQVPMSNMVGPDSLINRFDDSVKQKFYEARDIWNVDFLTPQRTRSKN